MRQELGVQDIADIFMAAAVERNMGTTLANRAVQAVWLVDILGVESSRPPHDNQVNILNPFVHLYVMVTRRDPRTRCLARGEGRAAPVRQRPHYTFDERKRSRSRQLADMVVLSADYMTVPDDQIKDIKPVMTISERQGRLRSSRLR